MTCGPVVLLASQSCVAFPPYGAFLLLASAFDVLLSEEGNFRERV